jgi:aconitate hydratase
MVRGTFANVRIKNLMVPGVEGGVTIYQPRRRAHEYLRCGNALSV